MVSASPPSDNPTDTTSRLRSALRDNLAAIGERYAAADRRLRAAQVHGDSAGQEAAEHERRDALGEREAAGLMLADLFLLLLRQAVHYRREAIEAYLADLLQPELELLANAILRLRGRS